MSQMYTSAGTGAATGAATGALAGSVLPGPGTAIGAVAGGVIGAGAGLMSGMGADAKAQALEEARRRYELALQKHQVLSEASANGYRGSVADLLNQNQASYDQYLRDMPGDQTASLNRDTTNQVAALTAAPPSGAALSGPLAQQYAAEGNQRAMTAINPMALNYSAGQQGQAVLANQRRHDLSALSINAQGAQNEQRFGLGQAQRDADLTRAQAAYARETGEAQTAGDRQMMYGALLQQGLNLGAQGTMAFGRPAMKPNTQTPPMPGPESFSESSMNGYHSAIKPNNPYGAYA